MKVYLVMTGAYAETWHGGVYSSAEKAMAAHPIPVDYPYPATPSASNLSRPGGWHQCQDGTWSNGLDWQASASIHELDLDDERG